MITEYFHFPPNPDIPEIEYLCLASDLPHFSFEAKIEIESAESDLYVFKSNGKQNKEDIKSKIPDITKCIISSTNETPENEMSQIISITDFKDICNSDSWMKDSTVQILTKWFNIVTKRFSGKCCVRSGWTATTIISHFDSYMKSKSSHESEIENKLLNQFLLQTERSFKLDKNDLPECVFMVQHLQNHWILVCICNIKTLNEDFVDVNKNNWSAENEFKESGKKFSEYTIPCFLVFDSFEKCQHLKPESEQLLNALRFWLSKNKSMNPQGISLNEVNMPCFHVECSQQQNINDCGYFVFRNIIGMIYDQQKIFPIKMKHIFKRPSITKFKDTLVSQKSRSDLKKIFNKRKSMKFSQTCIERLRKDTIRLFDRFHMLQNHVTKREKEIEKKKKNNNIIQTIKETLSESCSFEESSRSKSVLNEEKNFGNNLLLEFDTFFHDPKSTKISKDRKCFCPNTRFEDFTGNDKHKMPQFTFQCHRTRTEGTTFFINPSIESKTGEKNDEVDEYLEKIANGCSMHHSPICPDSGDCGIHLISNIICRSSSLIKFQNKMRSLMKIPLLFDGKGSNVRDSFKHLDCNLIIRQLVSQHLKNDDLGLEDMTYRETFINELSNLFEVTNKNKIRFCGIGNNNKINGKDIYVKDSWLWKKKRSKKDTTIKGKMTQKNQYDKFINLSESFQSITYSKIVFGYLLKFSSELRANRLQTFRDGAELYSCLPPCLVGRSGCHWMNEDAIAWFEIFFCVKVFVCRFGSGPEHFRPFDNLALMLEKSNEDESSDFYFQIKDNQIIPIGLVVILFDGSHYHCVLRNTGCDCPFYQIGKELPDMLYKGCNITKQFWEDPTICSKIMKHNETVIKNKMNDLSENNDDIPMYMKLHLDVEKEKYSLQKMTEIIYPLGKPNEIQFPECESMKVYQKGMKDGRYFTKFEASVNFCSFVLKPSYLAGLIFEYLINRTVEGEKRIDLVDSFSPKNHLLCGKPDCDSKILGTFAYDARKIWGQQYNMFENLVRNEKKKKKSDQNKNSEKSQDLVTKEMDNSTGDDIISVNGRENNDEKKHHNDLMTEVEKLMESLAVLTGKRVAHVELVDQLPKDSYLHGEFETIFHEWNNLLERKDQIYVDLKIIDINFDQKIFEQKQEFKDIFEESYTSYKNIIMKTLHGQQSIKKSKDTNENILSEYSEDEKNNSNKQLVSIQNDKVKMKEIILQEISKINATEQKEIPSSDSAKENKESLQQEFFRNEDNPPTTKINSIIAPPEKDNNGSMKGKDEKEPELRGKGNENKLSTNLELNEISGWEKDVKKAEHIKLNDNSAEEKSDEKNLIPSSEKLLREKNNNGSIDVQKKENQDEKGSFIEEGEIQNKYTENMNLNETSEQKRDDSESCLKINTEAILNDEIVQKDGKRNRVRTITVDNNDANETDNTKNNEKNNQMISDELDISDQSGCGTEKFSRKETNENAEKTNVSLKDEKKNQIISDKLDRTDQTSFKPEKTSCEEKNKNSKKTNISVDDESVDMERINLVTQLTDKIETKEGSNNTTQTTPDKIPNKNQELTDKDKYEKDENENIENDKLHKILDHGDNKDESKLNNNSQQEKDHTLEDIDKSSTAVEDKEKKGKNRVRKTILKTNLN